MSGAVSVRSAARGASAATRSRWVPDLALLFLGLAVSPACREPPDLDALADEVEALCEKDCSLQLDCVSEPLFDTHEACLEACTEPPGYLVQNACGTAARARLRCEAELTCDEYAQAWGAPLDAKDFPCAEEKYRHSTCDPDEP